MIYPLKWFVALFVICSCLLTGFNYVVDPIQYFSAHRQPVFVKYQRYQIPGLVRNYPFDSIILGTSLSENFRTEFLDKLAGSRSLNLAISGSSAWEQAQVAKMALATGKLKTVIWEMNYKSFAGIRPNLVSGGVFPLYLYQPDLTTLFYYLYSIDTLWLSVKALQGKGPRQLDGLNSWWDAHANKFDGKHVVAHYCQQRARGKTRPRRVPAYRDNIENELVALLTAYPQVKFQLFLPPFSVFNFALEGGGDRYATFRSLIYRVAEEHENVRLFDFTLEKESLAKVENYKDIEHYSLVISRMMLKTLSSEQERVAPGTVREESIKFDRFVRNWIASDQYCPTSAN